MYQTINDVTKDQEQRCQFFVNRNSGQKQLHKTYATAVGIKIFDSNQGKQAKSFIFERQGHILFQRALPLEYF